MKFLRGDRRWRAVTLNNAWIVEYSTDQGGVLRVEPARLDARFRIGVAHALEGEAFEALGCEVRLADADGRLWQCDSYYSPDVLVRHWLDLSRREPPVWESDAPGEWLAATKKKAILTDIVDSFDHRTVRVFHVGDMACYLHFKYLSFVFDLFHLDGERLLVRVREPFGSTNPLRLSNERGEPIPPPRESEEEEDEDEGCDYDPYPPSLYPLDVRRLLFRPYMPEGGWWDSEVSLPICWKRVAGEGTPQPSVTCRPPTISPPRTAEPGSFESFDLENRFPIDLPTTAGGVLSVEDERAIRFDACFSLAPGSEREPVDVVRCRLRVVDDAGGVWEATNHFTPEALAECWLDLTGREQPCFEGESSLEKARTMCANIRGILTGGWRHLIIGDWAVSIDFDSQKPRFDLLWCEPSYARLHVRIRGLTGYRRPIEVDHPGQYIAWAEGKRRKFREESLPPVLVLVREHQLLFRNTTFAVDDGFLHGSEMPIPVVFDRLDMRAEPSEGVRFEGEGG